MQSILASFTHWVLQTDASKLTLNGLHKLYIIKILFFCTDLLGKSGFKLTPPKDSVSSILVIDYFAFRLGAKPGEIALLCEVLACLSLPLLRFAKHLERLRNTRYAIRYTKSEVVIEVFRLAVVTVVACRFFCLGVNPDSLDALSLFCVAVNSN